MKWDIQTKDKRAITHAAVSKMRNVWHYQKYHPFLLPLVLYSSLLKFLSG
jgi:hypothetical protein